VPSERVVLGALFKQTSPATRAVPDADDPTACGQAAVSLSQFALHLDSGTMFEVSRRPQRTVLVTRLIFGETAVKSMSLSAVSANGEVQSFVRGHQMCNGCAREDVLACDCEMDAAWSDALKMSWPLASWDHLVGVGRKSYFQSLYGVVDASSRETSTFEFVQFSFKTDDVLGHLRASYAAYVAAMATGLSRTLQGQGGSPDPAHTTIQLARPLRDAVLAAGGKEASLPVVGQKVRKMLFCDTCGAGPFKKGYNLRRHQTAHDATSAHMCTSCPARFSQAENLRRHIRAVHDKHRPFACTMCSYHCSTAANLARHRRSMHPNV